MTITKMMVASTGSDRKYERSAEKIRRRIIGLLNWLRKRVREAVRRFRASRLGPKRFSRSDASSELKPAAVDWSESRTEACGRLQKSGGTTGAAGTAAG
jgi:hypothetical protein